MSASKVSRTRAHLLAVAVLVLSFGLALTSAVKKSPTMDEQNHIARGAAYLGTGDPRLSVEHPPLVNVLSALPAHMLMDLCLPLDQWWEAGEWYHFADNFLWRANPDSDRIVFLARLPIIGMGLLLTALVFRWASLRFGPWGGLTAATFCALDPNILAHTRLSTTDLGGTFFGFLAAYVFWRRLRRPSVLDVLLAGLTLGLAFAAKLSALVMGPILALVLLLYCVLDRPRFIPQWSRYVGVLAGVAVTSVLVVWATYGFRSGPLDGIGGRVPAAPYLRGVRAVLDLAGGGRPGYLLGEVSSSGWWYYFPVAFAVKTPLATLLGLGVAAYLLIRRPRLDDVFVLVPPVLFFLVSIRARLNLGYRHLLPMLPFLAVHIGRLAHLEFPKQSRLPLLLPVAAALWLGTGTLSIYPHFLAAFNPIGGGPDAGWHILADSNIDWGQDLEGLARWVERENVEHIRLSWFGSAPPAAYGIPHDLLPGVPHGFTEWEDPPFNPERPESGVYAISVSNLVGVALPNPDLYAWFRLREPTAKIGYSVFIYRVSESGQNQLGR